MDTFDELITKQEQQTEILENIQDYENYATMAAIFKRLEHLLKGQGEAPLTPLQTGFAGMDRFFGKNFNKKNFTHPDISIEDIYNFLKRVFLYSQNLIIQDNEPLITDPILLELIDKMGDSFNHSKLAEIIAIAKELKENPESDKREISAGLTFAIFSYLTQWYKSTPGGAYEQLLDIAINKEEFKDERVRRIIKNFSDMSESYGRLE